MGTTQDMTRTPAENKAAQIKRLDDAGLSHREIAEIVKSTVNSVSVTLHYVRNGYGRKGRNSMKVRMEPTLRDALLVEAKRRNMREQELARLILETVVRDRLFGAVFDDQADT